MNKFTLACIATTMAFGCQPQNQIVFPDELTLYEQNFFPEGIDFDETHQQLILGSIKKGKVVAIDHEGNTTDLISDQGLISPAGIYTDEIGERLLVTNSSAAISDRATPATNGSLGELRTYDLATGALLQVYNLAALYPNGGHLINDIAMDNDRNIYVTNTLSPVIFKIDAQGQASVFLESNGFISSQPGGFGLNGIVCHNNYLLVNHAEGNKLYKVPLQDPTNYTEVQLSQPLNSIADGMDWQKNGTLTVVLNPTGQLAVLSSDDDWQTATVDIQTIQNRQPTTITSIGEQQYVVYSEFAKMYAQEDVASFLIEKVVEE